MFYFLENLLRLPKLTKKRILIVAFTGVIVLIIIGVVLWLVLRKKPDEHIEKNDTFYGKAAIVSNGYECAGIGKQIFQKQGSIADVAIATLFCEGVSCPQSMGLGGGFFMTYFRKETNTVEVLNARETAPAAATESMFVANPIESTLSGKAIAIPGDLKGYWELHQKYGKLEWATLIEPSIKLCREGHVVTNFLAKSLQKYKSIIMERVTLSEIYINPDTNKPWLEGDIIKRPALANTLEIIAKEGANALYNGSLTENFVNDIRKYNGIITKQDLLDFTPRWEIPVSATIFNDEYKLFSVGAPGSGHIVVFIINLISGYEDRTTSLTTYHRIAESMKFGYALRSRLGDISGLEPLLKNLTDSGYASSIRALINDDQTYNDYNYYGPIFDTPDDKGTAHISIIGPNGDAIAVTSTINSIFGCKYRSQSTGIILNDEMDDFNNPLTPTSTIPTAPTNFIKPGKRPLSSMVPTIILNKNNDVVLVIGGAGGKTITSATTYAILQHIWFNKTIEKALDMPRLHHQLVPMILEYENGFDDKIIDGLLKKQHILRKALDDSGFGALTGIARENNRYVGAYDKRRGGNKEINFNVD